jgi:hypothetical protein
MSLFAQEDENNVEWIIYHISILLNDVEKRYNALEYLVIILSLMLR